MSDNPEQKNQHITNNINVWTDSCGLDVIWKGLALALTVVCGVLMLYIALFSKSTPTAARKDDDGSFGEYDTVHDGWYATDLLEALLGVIPAVSSIFSLFSATKGA